MVVNQKEADVYPQNVPYTFSTPFHRDYFLSKLSAFKNLSEATTPEAKNYCFLVEWYLVDFIPFGYAPHCLYLPRGE